jgi:hypothetical protein
MYIFLITCILNSCMRLIFLITCILNSCMCLIFLITCILDSCMRLIFLIACILNSCMRLIVGITWILNNIMSYRLNNMHIKQLYILIDRVTCTSNSVVRFIIIKQKYMFHRLYKLFRKKLYSI